LQLLFLRCTTNYSVTYMFFHQVGITVRESGNATASRALRAQPGGFTVILSSAFTCGYFKSICYKTLCFPRIFVRLTPAGGEVREGEGIRSPPEPPIKPRIQNRLQHFQTFYMHIPPFSYTHAGVSNSSLHLPDIST